MIVEKWKDIPNFEGYQVSDQGRVRSFCKRKHYDEGYGCYWCLSDEPSIMRQSDDGNGYMKVMLYCRNDGRRYCKKIHRLVAEAFIPHDDEDDTVDHIRSGALGKLDNSVENLRWMPRADNIRKAYRDGVCDDRIRSQRKDIIATDLWTGEVAYFSSIQEASDMLRLDRTSISHVLCGDIHKTSHYTFEYAGRGDVLLYGDDDKLLSWIQIGIL